MKVVVVGASDKKERYSHRALTQLLEKGHEVIPVHPRLKEIESLPVTEDLASVTEEVHTVTMYVGEERSAGMLDDLIKLKPQRVIFNPGAEAPALKNELEKSGIHVMNACTLVMLGTGQF
jgi:predicted CoA-binding protein